MKTQNCDVSSFSAYRDLLHFGPTTNQSTKSSIEIGLTWSFPKFKFKRTENAILPAEVALVSSTECRDWIFSGLLSRVFTILVVHLKRSKRRQLLSWALGTKNRWQMPTPQLSAAPYSCLLCWSTNVSTKAWWSHSGIICWRNCPVDASAPEAVASAHVSKDSQEAHFFVKRMHIRMRSKPTAEELPSFCPFPMWNWKGASQPIYFQLFSGRATDFQTAFLCGETFVFNFGIPKIKLRISGVFV